MLKALEFDCEPERARIVSFIRAQLAQAGYSRLVMGISGGLDSALVVALSVEAVGPEKLKAMILPYEASNPLSEAHARLVLEFLGVPPERFDITDMVRPLLSRHPDMSERRKGNIMARCRMTALYDQSLAFDGLVVGTGNRTETLLGYFTMHGDGAAAFKPIGHLYKCQVRRLARHMGVPEVIIHKAPSADLWQGQTDEGELGFTYDEADQVLYLLTEQGLSVAEVIAQGFNTQTAKTIARRTAATAFKRRLTPTLTTVGQATQ